MENHQFLEKDKIIELKKILSHKSTFNREYLLKNISQYSIQIEYWSRDTGHSWQRYFLNEHVPSNVDLSYADLNRTCFKKIADLDLIEVLNFLWELEGV